MDWDIIDIGKLRVIFHRPLYRWRIKRTYPGKGHFPFFWRRPDKSSGWWSLWEMNIPLLELRWRVKSR